jgi:hypothetical protein
VIPLSLDSHGASPTSLPGRVVSADANTCTAASCFVSKRHSQFFVLTDQPRWTTRPIRPGMPSFQSKETPCPQAPHRFEALGLRHFRDDLFQQIRALVIVWFAVRA